MGQDAPLVPQVEPAATTHWRALAWAHSSHQRRRLLVPVCLLLAACVPKQQRTVGYDVMDVPILARGPLSQYTLVIRPLVDQRPSAVAARRASDSSPVKVEEGDRTWYATSDDRYETAGGVPYAVSEAIAIHLRAAQLFRGVQVSHMEPPPGDFVLTGNLVEFGGLREERDTSEAFVGMFGLVGLVLSLTQDADLRGKSKLQDMKLIETATNSIVWQGDAEGSVSEDVPLSPDAAEREAFDAAKRSLRAAVDQLVRNLAEVTPPKDPDASR